MPESVKSVFACHICGEKALTLVRAFEELGQVTSDCRPWPESGRLACCGHCGATQKPVDTVFQDASARIYSEYEVYFQGQGKEQLVFHTAGAGAPRSKVLLNELLARVDLPDKGRFLDVGCGNGCLLRSASDLLPAWLLAGVELDARSRDEILAIPGVEDFYCGGVDDVEGEFDVVALLHCLEHIETPLAYLRQLRNLLRPRGRLLVQVPDYGRNPFDLVIADHCTHFRENTLVSLLKSAGYEIEHALAGLIPKELTVVAKVSDNALHSVPEEPCPLGLVQQSVQWLRDVHGKALQVASNEAFGLFGTSIAANWLFGMLHDKVDFFVDEDPARYGRTLLGKPVFSPQDVPREAVVFLALPPAVAKNVAAKLSAFPGQYVQPPSLR